MKPPESLKYNINVLAFFVAGKISAIKCILGIENKAIV